MSKQASAVKIKQSQAKRGSITVTLTVDFDQTDLESVQRAGHLIGEKLRAIIPAEDRETFLEQMNEAQETAIAKGILKRVTAN